MVMTSRAGTILALTVAGLIATVRGEQQQGLQVRAGYAPYGSTSYQPSADGLPDKTQDGQSGTNRCGTKSGDSSLCQNLYIAGPTDWCLYAPPTRGNVSDFEADSVTYCLKSGRGTRLIPPGTILGASFVYAPGYVQISGNGDFSKINIPIGDEGGELDAHGAQDLGNPKGDLVFVKKEGENKFVQAHEWMSMADKEFCIRACFDGPKATSLCRHTFDELGCQWNMPGHYPENGFEVCHTENAEDVAFYNGVEYHQKDGPPPDPHPAPKYLDCKPIDEKDLYGEIASNAFGGGNTTYKPYTGDIPHSPPAGTGGGVAVNGTGTGAGGTPPSNANGAGSGMVGTSGATKNGTGSSGSSSKPTSTNAAISVAASERIGYAFLALVTGLFAGCVFL